MHPSIHPSVRPSIHPIYPIYLIYYLSYLSHLSYLFCLSYLSIQSSICIIFIMLYLSYIYILIMSYLSYLYIISTDQSINQTTNLCSILLHSTSPFAQVTRLQLGHLSIQCTIKQSAYIPAVRAAQWLHRPRKEPIITEPMSVQVAGRQGSWKA